MRTLSSHLVVFFIGVILATAAGAQAHSTSKPSLAKRLTRLEFRHDVLQANYQTFCNTLRFATLDEIQDAQVRDLFSHLTAACWSSAWVPKAVGG